MKVSMQPFCTCTHVHSILARNRHKKVHVHVHVEKKRQCIMYTCTQSQLRAPDRATYIKGGCCTECYTFSCSHMYKINTVNPPTHC